MTCGLRRARRRAYVAAISRVVAGLLEAKQVYHRTR
jgi:hypothetical protein